jgi:hypothetical protein
VGVDVAAGEALVEDLQGLIMTRPWVLGASAAR